MRLNWKLETGDWKLQSQFNCTEISFDTPGSSIVTPYRPVGDLHRLAVVRDQDELRVLLHALEHLDEPADVRIVERRVDLVEQAERARPVLEDGEHQRHRGQRLLAAREQLDALEPLAWRLRDDVDAALELIVLVEQDEPGACRRRTAS